MGFKKGHEPWNKGKKGLQSHSAKTRKKISKSLTGFKRPPRTEEHRKNLSKSISKALKGRTPKNFTKEFQDKGHEACRGKPSWNKGHIGDKAVNWKGGGNAYWHQQARLIVEKSLGRKLKKGVVVHHIDGDMTNNANNNLLVCTDSYHKSLHRKLVNEYGGNWREKFGGVKY